MVHQHNITHASHGYIMIHTDIIFMTTPHDIKSNMSTGLESTLLTYGFDQKLVDQTLNSEKISKILIDIIHESNVNHVDKSHASLLYELATIYPVQHNQYRSTVIQYILSNRLNTKKQLDSAISYIKSTHAFDTRELEQQSGVGVVVTHEQIDSIITQYIKQYTTQLQNERYRFTPRLLGIINKDNTIKWSTDGAYVKQTYDSKIIELIGPKSEIDDSKPNKSTKSNTPPPPTTTTTIKNTTNAPTPTNGMASQVLALDELNDDTFVNEGRDIPEARNTPEHIAANKLATNNTMLTRFPPEPNGFLHIGHAKACNFNFNIAKRNHGGTIMRFDDTNPEAEKQIYIDNILENLEWLGHKPCKITFSSDYFDELFQLAVKLINKGKAYVDHQTAAEIKQSRLNKSPSPYRDRSINENLNLFYQMKYGLFDEGKATLRLKGDLSSPNPQISGDIVAYRIKYVPHPHLGHKWCIYPSYDFTHCIIDSLENITHSLCTLEFEVRRESYFWLLHELDLYKPKVWEYSRLNIEYNVMSKRKLLQLVNDGYVSGWDDPRMQTINGLRRRGYTADAINTFCDIIGVTRNANTIPITTLEHCIRSNLDTIAIRYMCVQDPVKVIITNYDSSKHELITTPNHPKHDSMGTHQISFSSTIYIDRTDIRTVDDKSYYGLAPNKEAHLKYAYNITCTKITKTDSQGNIQEVEATIDVNNTNKVKGNLHWVSSTPGNKPQTIELRLYDRLFKSADPQSLDNWLSDFNPASLHIIPNALIDQGFNGNVGDKYQFERLAFFTIDPDTNKSGKYVLNRTVALKEDKTKITLKNK